VLVAGFAATCLALAVFAASSPAERRFRFRVREPARGKLSEIRLRTRGPAVQPAARTVLLKVRRRSAPPPDRYPYGRDSGGEPGERGRGT
jgi:hypothetical protein